MIEKRRTPMRVIFLNIYIFFVICFFVPSTAFAYLDPGTGNALIYVLLSFGGAVIYIAKNAFYKFTGSSKKNGKVKENNSVARSASGIEDTIVLFNEGRIYWNTFKPIVEALISKQVLFSYYTMDIDDPCLLIDSPYMRNKYIGKGYFAFHKLGHLKANVVLSTTPNIGTKGFPVPRSSGIQTLAHVFHAFDDLSCYHKGSLDHYDAVLLVGPFEIPIIRKLESLRSLPEKELYPAGLPYLDELYKKKEQCTAKRLADNTVITDNNVNEKCTVLIASSWGEKGCLKHYGTTFIEILAKAGFQVIIRPHPQSLKVERDYINGLKNKLLKFGNVQWDFAVDSSASMQAADILISDTSSVRVDFLCVYQKPFITMPIPFENMQDFELADLKSSWKEEALARIGYTIKESDLEQIDKIVHSILISRNQRSIANFREDHIYNFGHSGEAIAEYLVNKANYDYDTL